MLMELRHAGRSEDRKQLVYTASSLHGPLGSQKHRFVQGRIKQFIVIVGVTDVCVLGAVVVRENPPQFVCNALNESVRLGIRFSLYTGLMAQ
jgi:hypothetical protein